MSLGFQKLTLINLGYTGALLYWIQRIRMKLIPDTKLVTLKSKYAKYPLKCRANTSDLSVIRQIFIEREYSCLDDVTEANLIIDCGANVGYSSAYLKSRYPQSELIAIEPDPESFELMKMNLAPYGSSVKLLRAAVWSHPTKLKLSDATYRDGQSWTRQVRECDVDEDSNLRAVDIGTLLGESGQDRISILKIDIEGSEAVLFSKNYESWIDQVDHLLIELHDDSSFGNATDIFNKAISGRNFSKSRCGELIVCRRNAERVLVPG